MYAQFDQNIPCGSRVMSIFLTANGQRDRRTVTMVYTWGSCNIMMIKRRYLLFANVSLQWLTSAGSRALTISLVDLRMPSLCERARARAIPESFFPRGSNFDKFFLGDEWNHIPLISGHHRLASETSFK